MGRAKNRLIEIEERGYGDSDKTVCSACIGDSYISKQIRNSHYKAKCSFCGKTRNVLPVNDVIEMIMKVINRDYMDAEGNVPYDKDSGYMEETTDTYDLIHYDLNDYLLIENEDLLNELSDTIFLTDKVRKDSFIERLNEFDLTMWNEFCELVASTTLSAEQIVSLINDKNAHANSLPDNLMDIKDVLEVIFSYCEKMHTEEIIHGINDPKRVKAIIRAVDHINKKPIEGLDFIPASLVGTAPPRVVSSNRMSEQGDMMFYGSDSRDTALKEYRETITDKDVPKVLTIGSFVPNKTFKILDLSSLSESKIPSIFDIGNERNRQIAMFLLMFMRSITIKPDTDGDKDKVYRPTQVFTKYIQRNTNYAGIKYTSAQVKHGSNYVLFVENRDCLNLGDEIDKSRYQLIMNEVEQIEK